ncbi:MAG: prolipoprotein diacylglyceryl transferase [Kiloniellales bacterium]
MSELPLLGALAFPDIDPVIFEIGPFALRWYALAYIVGLLLGWRYCRWLGRKAPERIAPEVFDDLLLWATLGVILGGRLGYVVFYNLEAYLSNPLDILMVWKGGMSFHGGALGVILACLLFARRHGIAFFALADPVAAATPIGLFFGRIANFVNSELYGRPTDLPWGMVFPADPDRLPRHPSQLYEAALEGAVLFLLMLFLVRKGALGKRCLLSGVFLAGYALARMSLEQLRQPDQQLGFLTAGTTMGQWLSLPMLAYGLYLIWRGIGRRA